MCGRINVYDHAGVQELMSRMGIDVWPQFEPRYNIAPTAVLDVLVQENESAGHTKMTWGILPKWARPGQFRSPLFNARAETIHDKPSFKNLVKNQRILVPVNGFYEWRRIGDKKTAFYISPSDMPAMFLAGIYQHMGTENSECCLITTTANESMATVHERMPVIIEATDAEQWLDKSDVLEVDALLKPAADDKLTITPVGDYVNNARHQGVECMQATAQ